MKRLIALFSLLIFVACEGSVGPPGPEGPQGPAGPVGQAFEVEADFNPDNEYSQLFTIPNDIEVLPSDIVVVYLLFDVSEDNNDIWQQLPATYYLEDGSQVQYGFDHTVNDVSIFLGGNTDFSTLDPIYTEDQIFRIAILPVDYVQSNKIDLKDMEQVMGAVKNSNKLQRIKLK